MKNILSILLVLSFCLLSVSCATMGKDPILTVTSTSATTATQAPLKDATLKAGFAERDFTPEGGQIPGCTLEVVVGVEVPLLANAAAFEMGEASLILISMDILSFKPKFCNEMRARITEATGVPAENIMITATHTHTGIALDYQLYLCPPNEEQSGHAADMAVEAAVEAWNNRKDASLGTGETYNDTFNFCREWFTESGDVKTWSLGTEPISKVDHSVNIVRVNDGEGALKCLIVNYANHPDTYTSKIKYSADYPGYMREALKAKYGEDVVVLYFNGCEGDVNYVDYKDKTHYEYHGSGKNTAKIIGETIARDVIKIANKIKTTNTPTIKSISNTYAAPQRTLSKEDYDWATSAIKYMAPSGLDYAFALEYTTEDYSDLGETFDIEIQTIVLGDFSIVGLPSEIFSEIGLKIKAASPYENTMVVGLANGTHGYIAPDFVQGTSSYVARFSKYNACAGVGTADILINNSVAQLKQMKNG